MKKYIKSVVTLVAICAVVSVLMAFTNYITAPIIAKNEAGKANDALSEVLPGGEGFELVDISGYTLPATVTEVYKASNGGYVVKLTTTGFSPNMVIMCGINADGTVAGAKCLSSAETNGAEKTYGDSLVGVNADSVDSVDTVSGSTMTTSAYKAAIKDALGAVKALSGEAVDFRTDEEIFRDNLKAALPAANGEFEAYLFVEEIEDTPGVIYAAKNGTGYVVVLDTTPQSFVGIDATGKIVTDCPAEDKSAIESAMAKIAAITTSDVDLSGFEGISSSVLSVKSTSAGSYIVDVTAKGYTSKYGAAPIHIRVSITEEGKIIDTLTVSQSESAGIGDACAKEEFYSQFDGKTEENYGEIDAITGATVTTNAYKKAILEAFKVVSIIKGGNE